MRGTSRRAEPGGGQALASPAPEGGRRDPGASPLGARTGVPRQGASSRGAAGSGPGFRNAREPGRGGALPGPLHLSDEDFARARALIEARTGIHLSPAKRHLVTGRLSRRVRALGLDSFARYLDAVDADSDGEGEGQHFINALTTNQTGFFREPHHFRYLAERLPGAVAARSPAPLRMWSAACSSGEEAYSLAMMALETLGDEAARRVRIHASDVDTCALETARLGVYPLEGVEDLAPERRRRFFLRGRGARAGQVRVREEVGRLVEFRRINLVGPWPWDSGLDVVLCRNVAIYFERPTQQRLFERLADVLRPGGLLVVGHAESLFNLSPRFRPVAKTVYERMP